MPATPATSPVLVIGGGPVGLVAAMRLGHLGLPVRVIESATSVSRALKASTFHPPTLEMLDDYGITQPLIDFGLVAPTWQVRLHATGEYAEFDLGVLADDTRFPFRLQAEQWKLSELLIEHIQRHLPRVEILTGHACVDAGTDTDSAWADVQRPDGSVQRLHAPWLIATDGASSQVRRALDLPFDGITFDETTILATTRFPFHDAIPSLSFINYCWAPEGTFSLLRLRDLWRVSLYPWAGETLEQATTPESVQRKLQTIYPRAEPYDILEIRPYRIHQRVIERYVHGRIVFAGDAAHINSPSGGMGMNGGIHDAFNLANTLGEILLHGATPDLVHRYERQRRPIAIKHVLEQSGRNRARMQERQDDRRRAALLELQRKATDPALARAHLLDTSMITSLREAAAIA